MKDEQKPGSCPSCGETYCALQLETGKGYDNDIGEYDTKQWAIHCTECGLCIFSGEIYPIDCAESKERRKREVIQKWNRRPVPEWTMEPPTEEGFYWTICEPYIPEHGKTVVRIDLLVGEPRVAFIGHNNDMSLDGYQRQYPKAKWLRIHEPKE